MNPGLGPVNRGFVSVCLFSSGFFLEYRMATAIRAKQTTTVRTMTMMAVCEISLCFSSAPVHVSEPALESASTQ